MTKAPLDSGALHDPIDIPFETMFVDPNNPRIAPETPPGYADANTLFDVISQADLIARVYEVYEAEKLEAQIIDQGWVPVDPIVVWRHPTDKRYIVIEGNTRTSVLTRVRERLPKEKEKLAKLEKGRGTGPETPEIRRQRGLVEKIESLIAETAKIRVLPIRAANTEELATALPRLHGVRHVAAAKPWGPHAVGLYIRLLYQERFEVAYPGEALRIDDVTIQEVSSMLPRKPDEIRKNIQAASAFAHFRLNYEDEAAKVGNTIEPSDQYFFGQILDNKVARDAFEFGPTDLNLSETSEAALFEWVFSKKRDRRKKDDDDDINVFQKAEDMRVWQRIANYDAKTGVTNFHKQLNVDEPTDAPPIRVLEARKNLHRQVNTPLRTLEELLEALRTLPGQTITDQAAHLRPMLVETDREVKRYIAMIDAAQEVDEGDLG